MSHIKNRLQLIIIALKSHSEVISHELNFAHNIGLQTLQPLSCQDDKVAIAKSTKKLTTKKFQQFQKNKLMRYGMGKSKIVKVKASKSPLKSYPSIKELKIRRHRKLESLSSKCETF